MIKRNKVCNDCICGRCPFNADSYLRICTGFKLLETLGKGLERAKETGKVSPRDYERLNEELDKEYAPKKAN